MSESKGQPYTFEQLMRIFKRIRDEIKRENALFMSDEEKMLVKNLDFLVSNYEQMKSSMPSEMLDGMGTPYQSMISDMVRQMSEQMGIDIDSEFLKEEDDQVETVEEEDVFEDVIFLGESSQKSDEEVQNEVEKIDQKLRKGHLSETEIDQLLDRRSEILARKQNS